MAVLSDRPRDADERLKCRKFTGSQSSRHG
jgi:hypothetical protein